MLLDGHQTVQSLLLTIMMINVVLPVPDVLLGAGVLDL